MTFDPNVGDRVTSPMGDGVIENGWASGTPWFLVKLDTGPNAGSSVWINENEYRIDAVDDGDYYNPDPDAYGAEFGMGGAFLPEWDGTEFTQVA